MDTVFNFIRRRYSRQGLWSLFLICALPLHVWTLILVFRDMSWVIERTNVWDAIGVASYGMVFALAESIIMFVVMALLGFLTPNQWLPQTRIGFLSLLVLILSVWAMTAQLMVIWNISLPGNLAKLLIESHHPVRYLYATVLLIITLTVLVPVYSFMTSKKTVFILQDLIERLSTLTVVYLLFDLLGILVVRLRNIL